ncbi:D-lactate dehydrogenase [Dyella sp. LX-66]|uniref:D-lactate dehydrogenase n=1 Tax=unclassified Dyella TaxID=2634549 RepID=UPI001BE0165A|nr:MULTISPECIES: D-lactate dehydrogenase [unclassified Dyella]MBT2115752.1 D-lactate dehydrogenase [Dyella sp. LX-1]MBT2139567.1 D-lactate dehydrogenase [Dyella sp. LX-66]
MPSPRETSAALLAACRGIVGARHVLTGDAKTRRYRQGYRFGNGQVLAVVRPGSLVEQWHALAACIAAGAVVITQASNTGLTGGSTPDGEDYGRDVVIVSTTRIRCVHLLDGGRQVVCVGGATLDQLERALKPLGREPHSVIGSSCIGASVLGGICNNSGGSLVQRGPAYTEMAIYAAVDAACVLRLVNHLGIELTGTPEEILARVEAGTFAPEEIQAGAAASDHAYASHVRDIDAATPARFNADPRRLFEASGCAGKIMVFAVRLDTFPAERGAKVFYLGTNATATLTELRRHVLANFEHLPIAAEYMHRDAFDVAHRYGKDLFLVIDRFGTERMPALFNLKTRCDAWFDRLGFLPAQMSDRIMQWLSERLPEHLPERLRLYRNRYEHHLMLKVPAAGVDEARRFLSGHFAGEDGAYFECTEEEGRKAFLHRFAAASAAVRYRAVHPREVEDIVALDIALPRNQRDWFERLPASIESSIRLKLYYGHFLCHVFHQDYIVAKGTDCAALEHEMLQLLDRRGAEYPAEHNVGHLYQAKPALAGFYAQLDPCNCFNPGIGGTAKSAATRP